MKGIFPAGGGLYFSNDLDTAIQISTISNVNNAVVTTASAHNLKAGDMILLDTPEWPHCSDSIYQVASSSSSSSLVLDKCNTENPDRYPRGGGRGGKMTKIKTWTTIPGVKTMSTSGGEVKYNDISLLFAINDMKEPNGYTATSVDFVVMFDPKNDVFNTLTDVTNNMDRVALKISLSGSTNIYVYGYLSYRNFPNLTAGQPLDNPLSFATSGQATVY